MLSSQTNRLHMLGCQKNRSIHASVWGYALSNNLEENLLKTRVVQTVGGEVELVLGSLHVPEDFRQWAGLTWD